jgi:hypothetical protein
MRQAADCVTGERDARQRTGKERSDAFAVLQVADGAQALALAQVKIVHAGKDVRIEMCSMHFGFRFKFWRRFRIDEPSTQ